MADYWDHVSLGDDYYRPDPMAPGSWRDLYWWRIIISMRNKWESEKYKSDSSDRAEMGGGEDSKRPLKKYDRNQPRKMPKLPSQGGGA